MGYISFPLKGLPGLIHLELVSGAAEVLDVSTSFAVDAIPDWIAHSQEVWAQATNGVLGYVRKRLARSSSEHVAPHGFVDARHVLGPQRLVPDARHVNRKALATDDLQQRTQSIKGPVLFCCIQGSLCKKTTADSPRSE